MAFWRMASVLSAALLGQALLLGEGTGDGPGGSTRVAQVMVTVGTLRPVVGQTTQAYAEMRDASGRLVTCQPVTWTSNNDAVASVDSSGVVTAKSAGSATLTATCGEASGSVTLSVQPLHQRSPMRAR